MDIDPTSTEGLERAEALEEKKNFCPIGMPAKLLCVRRTNILDEEPKVYNYLLTYISSESKEKIKGGANFAAIEIAQDSVVLWNLALFSHYHGI